MNQRETEGLIPQAEPWPEGGAVKRSIVTFDVEEYVDGYEFAGDEGFYTPTEDERALLTDAIHGVLSELSLATREEAPALENPDEPSAPENARDWPSEEAPAEAGVQETLRVLLDNLVIAQSLSKELRQRATDEARSYLSALRAQPQARSGEGQ